MSDVFKAVGSVTSWLLNHCFCIRLNVHNVLVNYCLREVLKNLFFLYVLPKISFMFVMSLFLYVSHSH